MKLSTVISASCMFFCLFSCGQRKSERAFMAFNEGVRLNLNAIEEQNKGNFEKAFSMDTSREIKEITIQDLTEIGKLAFEYGDGYIKQGEPQKGNEYKTFSLSVLMLAFEYDRSRKDIALTISDFAEKIGDKEIANKYKTLSTQ